MRFMDKVKAVGLIVYPVAVFLIWSRLGDPAVFTSISFRSIWHGLLLAAATFAWFAMLFVFVRFHFYRWTIQQKLEQAARPLGNIAAAKLLSYTPSKTGHYVTMAFFSGGTPEEDWEHKRTALQSAINYTILGKITHHPKDYGIIVLNARKGCPQAGTEVLQDDEL